MATSMLWVATLILCSALSLTEQVLPDGGGLGENRYGACICHQNYSSEDVLQKLRQLDDKLLSLSDNGENRTENIVQLERKMDLLLEKLPSWLCPRDFTYSSESKMCIKLYTDTRTWAAANDSCHDIGQGFRLAVPDTAMKLQFVQTLSKNKGYFWLGGRKENGEGRWLWLTGDEIIHGWGNGEPNNHNRPENCLSLHVAQDGLNDLWCTHEDGYICEYQLI